MKIDCYVLFDVKWVSDIPAISRQIVERLLVDSYRLSKTLSFALICAGPLFCIASGVR